MRDKFKRYFLTGLIVLFPLGLTFYFLWIFFSFVAKFFMPLLHPLFQSFLGKEYIPFFPFLWKLSSFLLALFLVWMVGLLATNFLGKKVLQKLNQLIERLPFIREFYLALSKLTHIFLAEKIQFQRVVLIEYPRKGIYAFGFVTNEKKWKLGEQVDDYALSVFLPTTPNPTSGFLLLVPEKEIIPVEINIEEAMKMVISGGLLAPEQLLIKSKNK